MKIIGIIGGTGVYSPDLFLSSEEVVVKTLHGDVTLVKTEYRGTIVYFLERHGKGHKVAPHNINYLANISALKIVGAEIVFSTAAVGSLNHDIPPGSFVIVDQFLDFTKNRPSTLWNGDGQVVHVDMTNPYCPELRNLLIALCKKNNIKCFEGGTYVCTEGPRFENKAEIAMFRMLGGTVVGMTNYPEVVLAREANLCYATVCMVTNYATGISTLPLTHKEVMDNMGLMSSNIAKLFLDTITEVPEQRPCECKNATMEQGNLK